MTKIVPGSRVKTMRDPSGDQFGPVSLFVPLVRNATLKCSNVKTAMRPSRVIAILGPSGDQAGDASSCRPRMSGCCSLPSTLIAKTSSSSFWKRVNASWSPFGDQVQESSSAIGVCVS